MTPRETILAQIDHHETAPVPFTLSFEGDVAERLDAHYGGGDWRERLTQYMVHVGAVDTWPTEEIAPGRIRDAYGTVWRTDRRPWHIEAPALASPSFDGYDWPDLRRFARSAEDLAEARQTCDNPADRFRIGYVGWGLFERSWTIRGFENALMDVVAEEDFYAELLDRLGDLYATFVAETVKLPIDAVMFGDDWGDQRGVIVGPDRWRKLFKPRWASRSTPPASSSSATAAATSPTSCPTPSRSAWTSWRAASPRPWTSTRSSGTSARSSPSGAASARSG